MTKKWLLILLVLWPSLQALSQGFLALRSPNTTLVNHNIVIGAKFGTNTPFLYYTDPNLANLPHGLMVTPSAGAFAEIPLHRYFSMVPEISYHQRGGSTSYLYEGHRVNYKLKAGYVDLRIPICGYMVVTKAICPYLFVSPDLGLVVGGRISLSQPNEDGLQSHSTKVNNSNINQLYAGLVGGMGVRMDLSFAKMILVVKADLAVNWGLLDTFSNAEHAGTANPLNVNAYNITGNRYSRGLELNISIGFIQVDFHPWLQ